MLSWCILAAYNLEPDFVLVSLFAACRPDACLKTFVSKAGSASEKQVEQQLVRWQFNDHIFVFPLA